MTIPMRCTRCDYRFQSRTVRVDGEFIPRSNECPQCSGDAIEVLDSSIATYNYPMEMLNGHLIADLDGRKCLLDTGSINCISGTLDPFVDFAGKKWHATRKFLGVMLKDISKQVGVTLDCIIGSNALSALYWQPLIDEGIVSVHTQLPPYWDETMAWKACDTSSGPAISIDYSGDHYTAMLDTGAKVCYARQQVWDGMLGNVINTTDFFPTPKGIELFNVPMKIAEIGLGAAVRRDGKELKDVMLRGVILPIGVLPEHLEGVLSGFGADFLLGPELIQGISIGFALPEKKIFFMEGVL